MPSINGTESISFDGMHLLRQIKESSFSAVQLSTLIGYSRNYLSNACSTNRIPVDVATKLESAGFTIVKMEAPKDSQQSCVGLPENFDERVEAALYKAMKKLKAEEADGSEEPEEPQDLAVPVDDYDEEDYEEEQPDPFAVAIHWIPCYASLPRTNELVIITQDFFSKADKEYVRKVFAARYEKGKWMIGQKELFSTVHAWAKMPEPYME